MLRTVYMYIMYTVYFFRNIYMHVHAYIAIKHRIYIISVKKKTIIAYYAFLPFQSPSWFSTLVEGRGLIFSCKVLYIFQYQLHRTKPPTKWWMFSVCLKNHSCVSVSKFLLFVRFCFLDIGQQLVNRWFGILGLPISNNPFHSGDPRNPNHRAPDHQLTIRWIG